MRPSRSLIVAVLLPALALAVGNGLAQPPQIEHHDITVRLDPDSRAIQVEDSFAVETRGHVTFELADWIRLEQVEVDGRDATARRHGGQVTIPAPGDGVHTIGVSLRGVVPALPPPEAQTLTGSAMADREGSYLPGYSGWLPIVGNGTMQYHLMVEVPLPYKAVAPGRLEAERQDNEHYRASFVADYPSEAPSIFAGPYEINERREGGLRIRTYFHRELTPLAAQYMAAAAGYIHRYADRIGPYPYSDFHIVSAPLPVGLGFPNLTYVGRRVLPLPFMRGRSLAHEILHCWWGNAVSVDYAGGNWAEGLTTYMADYALADQQGSAEAYRMRLGWLQSFAALPADRDMPVVRFTSRRHDATQIVGYNKVAFIFHMLERELGTVTFNAGLRTFWKAHRFGTAGWRDLQTAFETAAGRDLSWFFREWLRRKGAPKIELANAERRKTADGHLVTLTLRQQEPIYRLRVPVVIETASGTLRREVILERKSQTFRLATDSEPLSVQIDPDLDAFRRLLPGESPPIIRDVTLSRNTMVIVPTRDAAVEEAARFLAQRLLQRPPELHQGDLPASPDRPVLAIGTARDIADLRARLGSSRPANDITRLGTARAWTEILPGGSPILFVSADDAPALAAVLRPLPHYRGESYIAFQGSRSIRKGLWPVTASPLRHRFGR